jgi:hypothetical protein
MATINFQMVMSHLSARRSVFHSEADFQFALAWEIQSLYPTAAIYFEKPFAVPLGSQLAKVELDLFVVIGSTRIAIEMKYPKARWSGTVNGEDFNLSPTGQSDRQLRLFAEDLRRVEALVTQALADEGHAVLLTNSAQMWQVAPSTNNQYHDFTLPNGRRLPTQLVWASDPTSQYTVNLNKTRLVSWHHFSTPPGTAFNYLVLDA